MDEASKRSVLLVAALGYATLVSPLVVLAGILLFVAETWQGHVYAVAGLTLLALPPLVVRALPRRPRARAVAAGAALLFTGLVVLLYLGSPQGRPLPGSRLRSEFLGDARYRRLAVAALLPEIDQVKLGTYAAPVLDPLIDRHEAVHIREVSLRHYRPMERDPELVALGTVMPDAYADRDAAHLYAYAPPHDGADAPPAIVFLHGSAGAFKAYFYLWRRFADRTGTAVVLPSFGWGNWYEAGGVEAVERARAWAVGTLGADPRRIFLVGLSNGGTGVTRAAAANPGAYCGIGFLSGVLEDGILRGPKSAPRALPWPIFILHGRDDDRIPIDAIDASVERLRAQGGAVDYRILERQDHFLFFDRDEEVLAAFEEWMRGALARRCATREDGTP